VNDDIIEAAARALFASEMPGSDWEVFPGLHDKFLARARAVTLLVRNATLEEAAHVAENHAWGSYQVAAAIRTLKEQP
jgi:phosphoribosyl 1,2-cyclic phosphodiesterase